MTFSFKRNNCQLYASVFSVCIIYHTYIASVTSFTRNYISTTHVKSGERHNIIKNDFERCFHGICNVNEIPQGKRNGGNILAVDSDDDAFELPLQDVPNSSVETKDISFRLCKRADEVTRTKKKRRPWRRRGSQQKVEETTYHFQYQYNEMKLSSPRSNDSSSKETMFVLLIQPIGVGIGRWYYDRLLNALKKEEAAINRDYVLLVPDLLGSGSACDPLRIVEEEDPISGRNEESKPMKKLPLFTPSDWSRQIIHLMSQYEQEHNRSSTTTTSESRSGTDKKSSWCVVSNGGCVSIALEVGKQFISSPSDKNPGILFQSRLSNIILSAVPRLSALQRSPDLSKVQKSYKTLSGRFVGNLFWWYSLRNNGAFVQKFSEKNLAARPENLGDAWRPKCVATAKAHEGKSRFSTFAFLAGSLNGGCQEAFEMLGGISSLTPTSYRDEKVQIDIIRGEDKRRNSARSWFWGKRKKEARKARSSSTSASENTRETASLGDDSSFSAFPDFLQENGNGGRIKMVGGRICLAHEDAEGYTKALLELLEQ